VLSDEDMLNVIQSEVIPVTGEGYDVMLDIIFPKGPSLLRNCLFSFVCQLDTAEDLEHQLELIGWLGD